MTNQDTEKETEKTSEAGGPPRLLLVIAVVLLALYVIVVFFLFRDADDNDVSETIWSRYTYLLGGLEAVVFTAVGWLFGREVNRKQAEQAEEATQEAADAKAKGEGLKQAILAHPTIAGTGQESIGDGSLQALLDRAQATQF